MDSQDRLEQARTFLKTLFGACEKWFYLWSLRKLNGGDEKKTWWFPCSEWEAAAQTAMRLSEEKWHVYVGVSLAKQAGSPHERVEVAAAAGIVGLWAEADFGTNGHKKTKLPPDAGSARSLIESMPLRLSGLIHSGGGWYGWWLFKEPWVFDSPAERQRAVDMARGWNVTLLRKARDKGWEGDNVGDLARVLRLPGTFNWKHDPPLVCMACGWENGPRYDPSDADEFTVCGQPEEVHMGQKVAIGDDAGALQAVMAITALAESKRKIKQTWERRRTDLKDDSLSGYDWELARLLIESEWDDQAIANALAAFRSKHGGKPVTAHYYQRTLARARSSAATSGSVVSEIDQQALRDLIASVRGGGDGHEDRLVQLAAALSKRIGGVLKVLRARRYEAARSIYIIWVETSTGGVAEVSLGDVSGVTRQDRFRESVYDATGIMPPKIKSGWDLVTQAIWALCEQETITEATSNGQAECWLDAYLSKIRPIDDKEGAIAITKPFRENGHVFFFLDHMRKWLRLNHGVSLGPKELGVVLRSYGCTSGKLNIGEGAGRTTKSVWTLFVGR